MKIGIKKYHGFLIDADNTIFDYDRSEREAFIETMNYTLDDELLESSYIKFRLINQYLWKDFENKKIEACFLHFESFKILKKTINIKEDVKKIASRYLDKLSQKTYVLPNTIKTLEFLSHRASLCLITNGPSYVQRSRIARAELEVFFNSIIIAEEIGSCKPEPSFFEAAVKSINLPAYSILCAGDTPSSDIRGGHNYGLDTCWLFNKELTYPIEEPFPDYIIVDFSELMKFSPEMS